MTTTRSRSQHSCASTLSGEPPRPLCREPERPSPAVELRARSRSSRRWFWPHLWRAAGCVLQQRIVAQSEAALENPEAGTVIGPQGS